MNSTMTIFARLNVMYKYEFDSSVENKVFDWTKFTGGLSKKDNQKWLDDNFKEKYYQFMTTEGKNINWSGIYLQ